MFSRTCMHPTNGPPDTLPYVLELRQTLTSITLRYDGNRINSINNDESQNIIIK